MAVGGAKDQIVDTALLLFNAQGTSPATPKASSHADLPRPRA